MDRNREAAYQETLDYLYRFVDYSLVRNFRFSPEKFNLSRMEAMMEKLGNPHRRYPVVHVAGTKGKGSTSALVASALTAAGYKTGFYSSPHLNEFTERLQIDGQQIDRGTLVQIVADMKPFIEQVPEISWFEITTALSMEWFARQGVQIAVIEVGLGGRLDATNIVDPQVAVITSLSMDHMAVLGDTLAKIAFEKAGIIKPGRPVVTAPQQPEALEVVRQVAQQRGCRLVEVGRDVLYRPLAHSLEGQTFQLDAGSQALQLAIPLLGLHQVENAALAFAALQVVRENGLSISDEAIHAGFGKVAWPGRFELLRHEPPVIVDSAHNRDSARRLRQAIDDYLPGRPVVLVFGASEDKDITGILEELLPRARQLIATQSEHPRATEAEKLVALASGYGCPAQAVVPIEEAVALALEQAGSEAAIVATGSLFIAAAVRDVWNKKARELSSI